MTELWLSAREMDEVGTILRNHLPAGVRVDVFGSRATGRGLKPHSDLDLLLTSTDALPLRVVGNLRDAFSESNLPFRVDLLQRNDASADFLASIQRAGMIELVTPTIAA